MTDESLEVIREKICVTCLSQNRTLFPVKHLNVLAMLNLNFLVTEKDKMCWECRHVAMKIVTFKNQAEEAQATLNAVANGLKCEIESLSRLSRSSEVTVVTNEASDDEDFKCEETDHVEDFDEAYDHHFEHVDVEPYVEGAVTEVEEGRSQTKPKPMKDAPKSKVKKRYKNQSNKNADPNFTVVKLTKNKMLQWREKKRNMEFYTDSAFKCAKCIEPMENATLYGAHKKKHTKVYGKIVCRVCKLRFIDVDAMDLHSKTHYRLLKCNFCAHEWDSANGMRRHCSEVHGEPVTSWACDLCPSEFSFLHKLTGHTRCHRLRICPECGKTLRSSLKKHMNCQHGELPLRSCMVCNQQCKGDSGLKLHMEKHSSKVEDTTFCIECNMGFRNKYVYRSHMRNTVRHATAADLRYKCKECGKGFLDNFALTNHVDAMHDKRKKYECNSCGEGFRTVVARRKHIRQLHEGKLPPRNKICDYCGKAFQTRAFLRQHINSHTGARPYNCKLCDAAFGYRSALYLHGRFVHEVNKRA